MSQVKILAALKSALASVPAIIPAVSIASVSLGSPAVFTTSTPHLLVSGLDVIVSNYVGATPNIDGMYRVTVLSASTFTLQNSATKALIGVTIAGSGGSVLANLTSWPNASFQCPVGVPYQEVDILVATPYEPTQGGGYRKEQGILQVTLNYPRGVGDGAMTVRSDLIRSYFPKGATFAYGGVTVGIPKAARLGTAFGTADSYCIPIKITYDADIFG